MTEPRTFDLRLWVTADPPGPVLARFLDEVRELADAHPGIEPFGIAELHESNGHPRIHRPPHYAAQLAETASDAPRRSVTNPGRRPPTRYPDGVTNPAAKGCGPN